MTHPGLWTGSLVIATVLVVAVLAPELAPHDPYRSGVDMLDLPSPVHLLGTDDLGRDILSRVIYGARASLLAGVSGGVSGFFGRPTLRI